MGWLGIDDTDTLDEGCTTWELFLLLQSIPDGVQVGQPRLVRLWPFAEGRTRGNAALSVELIGDESIIVSFLDTYWNERLKLFEGRIATSHHSDRTQSPASPGMVWFSHQPAEAVYWKSVRRSVTLDELPPPDVVWGNQGVVGATAAVAWRAHESTWEAISWCSPTSTPRFVCPDALLDVDNIPGTFMSRNPKNGNPLITPRAKSPILWGIRAISYDSAYHALHRLLNSPSSIPTASMIFQTNQALDDHIEHDVTATVVSVEVNQKSGHVKLRTSCGSMIAYHESGPVNRCAKSLTEGDVIIVKGLVDQNDVLHIEKIKILMAMPRKKLRPMCSRCNVRMKSMGSAQGVRCPTCKQRSTDDWVTDLIAQPNLCWHEPDASYRRHLARPLLPQSSQHE